MAADPLPQPPKRGRKKKRPPDKPKITVSITAFADDLCFYITGGPIADLQVKAQEVMDKASAWAQTKGMRFSSAKTVPVIFSRTKYDTPNNIILNGVPLEYGKVVKYLGVYIDHKLLWNEHVNIKIKMAKKLLMNIVRVCHPTWGISPWAANYYWKSCIRPMLTYGCLVWHRVCRYKHTQKKFKSFQRMALKMMGPLRHSTPTRGLEIINYCRPLELECRRIAAEAYIRTQGKEKVSPAEMQTTKVTQKGHRQFCQEFLQEINYPLIDKEIDTCPRKWSWNRKFEVDRTNLTKGDKYGLPTYDTRIQVYGGATLHQMGITATLMALT